MDLRDRELLSSAPLKTIYRGKYGAKPFWGKIVSHSQKRKMGRGQMTVWCGGRVFQKREEPRVQVSRGGHAKGFVGDILD